tara:strand:- start:924 stop:1373 length:450 start_codon:yes stop_codon:yes gene_type:complete
MYRDASNQSGDFSEVTACLDLIKRGWIVNTPSSRDCVYDLLVDTGRDSDARFQTIQVKTMSGNSITKIIDRSKEVVSKNGKTRNSLDYADHGIDWLVGVNKDGECFFYHYDTYSQISSKSFSVLKYPPDQFPTFDVPNRHRKIKKDDNE